jgi:endonuclease III
VSILRTRKSSVIMAPARREPHTKASLTQRRLNPRIIRRVCELLEATYGKPRLGNPQDPVDDLVFVVLSNKTSPKIAADNYKRVKERFPTWNRLLASHPNALRQLIEPGGLSVVKARQIWAAISKIAADFGSPNLNGLRSKSPNESEKYLCSLPGVSKKVAKCILIYTLGAQVLPVDVHVHRVASRLGWATKKRADQCHEELEELIPPDRRYSFHVDCIAHGRTVCHTRQPLCDACCIKRHCEYFRTIYSLSHTCS